MKKNYNKIPKSVLGELECMETNCIKIGYIKRFSKLDVQANKYKHLSLFNNNGTLQYDSCILPEISSGRYSKYNQIDKTIIKRDLPKIIKIFCHEIYPYGNTSASTVTAYISREVWQREIILPQYININIELIEETNDYYELSFEIDKILLRDDPLFQKHLLDCINIMQENVGGFYIYAQELSIENVFVEDFVNWELLPPGTVDKTYLQKKFPKKSEAEQKIALQRYEFIQSLDPLAIFKGTNSFNYYFGAKLKNGIVILENVNVGNAIYIFYDNWENLTKLSRTDLIRLRSDKVDRILHSGLWENHVRYLINNYSDSIV